MAKIIKKNDCIIKCTNTLDYAWCKVYREGEASVNMDGVNASRKRKNHLQIYSIWQEHPYIVLYKIRLFRVLGICVST